MALNLIFAIQTRQASPSSLSTPDVHYCCQCLTSVFAVETQGLLSLPKPSGHCHRQYLTLIAFSMLNFYDRCQCLASIAFSQRVDRYEYKIAFLKPM